MCLECLIGISGDKIMTDKTFEVDLSNSDYCAKGSGLIPM